MSSTLRPQMLAIQRGEWAASLSVRLFTPRVQCSSQVCGRGDVPTYVLMGGGSVGVVMLWPGKPRLTLNRSPGIPQR